MSLAQTIRGALLTDFLGAFWLATLEMFRRKATVNYPFEKNPLSPRFRGEHACAATHPARSVALHASCVKQSARRRRLRSRPSRALTARAERHATISTW